MKVKVKVIQLCPTLCNPMNYTVHGILQARILEWVAFPFSKGSSQGVMAPFYFGHFCFPHSLVGLNKMVNWGKLKIIKKMSSCRNRRGNAIQDTNCSKQQVLRVGEGCTDGQESKEGRVHTESVKIKTETSVKIPRAHRMSPVIQSSVQLVFWDQPHLGYFLFMPLETISKTSQGWYEATMTKSPTV